MYTSSIQNSIKIVIWDLDETVFDGILAEDHHLKLKDGIKDIIIELSRRGILNSVCSFNDYTVAKDKLIEFGLWDYFIFPQISYRSKADSIKKMLSDIHLLPDNALFVDNDERQLAHVKQVLLNINLLNAYYYKDILVNDYVQGEANDNFSRLGQYKVLEAREQESQKFNNDTDFLMSLNLTIKIEKFSEKEKERVNKLLNRAHQLNYASSTDCELSDGYCVRAYDKFGDMGVVGYYNIQAGVLKCFVFSCRVINLGIEQWVYSYLGCPEINSNENVAVRLNKCLDLSPHITLTKSTGISSRDINSLFLPNHMQKVFSLYLFGACDMHRCSSLFDLPNLDLRLDYNSFVKDYRALNSGSEYIRTCIEQGEEEKEYLKKHFSNYTGDNVFSLRINEKKFDVAIFSFSDDAICYLYHHKDNKNFKMIGENKYGMPRVYANNNGISETMRKSKWVQQNFVEEGFISYQRFCENLACVRKALPIETLIMLVEIPECDYARRGEKQKEDIYAQIQMLNAAMTQFCQDSKNNAIFLRTTDIVNVPNGYSDYFLHWNFETCKGIVKRALDLIRFNNGENQNDKKRIQITIISNDFTGELIQKVYQIAGFKTDIIHVMGKTKEEVIRFLSKMPDDPNKYLINTTGEDYRTDRPLFTLMRESEMDNNFVPMFYSFSLLLKDFQGFKNKYLTSICHFKSIYIPIYFCTLCQTQSNQKMKNLNPYNMALDEYFDLAKDVKHISYRECAEYFIFDNLTIFSGMKIVQIDGVCYSLSQKFENGLFYLEARAKNKIVEKDICSFSKDEWKNFIKSFATSVTRVYGSKVIFIEPNYVGVKDELYDLYLETNELIKESLNCYTITSDACIERTVSNMSLSYDARKIENEIELIIKEKMNVE